MKLYLPITVDLYNVYPLSVMNVQQNNIGRGALVTLTAAGQVVVPTKESLYVYAKKQDGTMVYATCTMSGSQIKIDYDEQMTAAPGTMTMELQMVDASGNSITTPIFMINVQPSNINYRTITSSDEFSALVDALSQVNSFQGQIDDLNEKLIPKKVMLSNFFDSSPNVELIEMEVLKADTIVELYARIEILSNLEGNLIGAVKELYRPLLKEVIVSAYSAAFPYSAVGSIWVGKSGDVRMYGHEVGKQYYINAIWLCPLD